MVGSASRLTAALASALTAVALAGCGGSSTSSMSTTSTSSAVSSSASASATTPSTASTTTTTSSSTASPMPTTTSSVPAAVSTAPPPIPAGTPPAPAGLRQSTGYSTYELCSVHCTGAVPSSLRRALHVSGAKCGSPSAAPGPVTPSVSGTLPVTPFIGSKWDAGRVTWTASPGFIGPILIRGAAVGGSGGAVGFGEGRVPYDELQLYDAAGKPQQWQSFTRVRGPGCYAYQVDTASGSAVIAFTAR